MTNLWLIRGSYRALTSTLIVCAIIIMYFLLILEKGLRIHQLPFGFGHEIG